MKNGLQKVMRSCCQAAGAVKLQIKTIPKAGIQKKIGAGEIFKHSALFLLRLCCGFS
jgi:hypothetical protein